MKRKQITMKFIMYWWHWHPKNC